MNKFFSVLCVVAVLWAGVAFSDVEEPINTAIDDSAWTAIALDGLTPCSSYVFQSRDGSDFKWKKTAASTNYFTVRDGGAFTITFEELRQPTTLFYAQSVSGTPTIEVFILNQRL